MMKRFFLLALVALFTLPVACQTQSGPVKVLIETDLGNIKAILYDETPLHRDNFVKLVNEGWYDGTIFHRVIRNFMIQGGARDGKSADHTVPAEIKPGLYHKKGALAAARLGDQVNPEKASSGSQFYIVQGYAFDEASLAAVEAQTGVKISEEARQIYKSKGGTPHLDGGYTVFGEVIEGFEVIDRIAAVPTAKGDKPRADIKMKISIIR